MHKHLRGLAALGAATTIGAAAFAVVTPAFADGTLPSPGQDMTLTPATGTNMSIPRFTTSGGCPTGTTHVYAQLFGPGLSDTGQLLMDPSRQSPTAAFTVEATRRLQDAADARNVDSAGRPTGATSFAPGLYRTELVCSNASLARLQTYTDDLRFTSATAYTTDTSEPVTHPAGTVRPITNACPDGTPRAPFTDVRPNTHELAIDCILHWRVTSGQTATTYGVAGTVNRGQMARFIANVIRESGGTLPAGTDRFADDNGNQFEADINALVQAGVVSGRPDGTYGPLEPVFRDQMATFLVNAYQYRTAKTLGSSKDYFTDDAGNTHEPRIDRAAEAGFTGGTGGSNYSPRAVVRRDAMGSFLARVLDKLAAEDGAVRRQ